MTSSRQPFPNPPIPDFDTAGRLVPPWVKYPNIPLGSLGWRMGKGEDYWYKFRDWWLAQDGETKVNVESAYPEPEMWNGFYGRIN